jgi:hypothetical protein
MSLPDLGQPVPRKDITLKKNADFTLAICIVEVDELGNRVVVDTTGWVVKMQVRELPYSTSPVLMDASTDNGRVIVGINGDPGEEVNIDIKVPASVTNGITAEGEAGYDLRATLPDGTVEYYMQGYAYLQGAYTY